MASYNYNTVVVVRIDEQASEDVTGRFLRWCLDEQIYAMRGGSVGPSGMVQFYPLIHKEKILRWLRAEGVRYQGDE